MPAPTAKKLGKLHPFTGQDMPWLLRAQAERRKDHPFIIWAPFDRPSASWTYGEFYQATRKIAAGLLERGIEPGDYVLLHMNNCPEFLMTWHACSMIGAIIVTTNTRSAKDELTYFIDLNTGRILRMDIHADAWAKFVSIYFEDWRRVAGLQRPYRLKLFDRDKASLMQTITYEAITRS